MLRLRRITSKPVSPPKAAVIATVAKRSGATRHCDRSDSGVEQTLVNKQTSPLRPSDSEVEQPHVNEQLPLATKATAKWSNLIFFPAVRLRTVLGAPFSWRASHTSHHTAVSITVSCRNFKNYRASRRPKLLRLLSGVRLSRVDTRQSLALKSQQPPRNTRSEPEDGP